MKKAAQPIITLILLALLTQKTHAATVTKTFSFATTSEGFVAGNQGKATLSYDSGTGNPAGSIKSDLARRNGGETPDWTWSGTWESLGVPTGATVTNIRVNAGYTRCTAYNTVTTLTVGPYKLQDSSGVDQATMWSGRTPTATDGSWISIGTQADQTVPVALQASNSSIRLFLGSTFTLGNNASAQATFSQDEISFVITYTPIISITLSSDGSVAFGNLGLDVTQDTTAGGIDDVEVVSIDAGPADLDIRSTTFADGGANTWALGTSSNSDQVHWEFSKDGTAWTTFAVADQLYTLDTNVSQGSNSNLYLRITTPTDTTSYSQHSSTITIVASAP